MVFFGKETHYVQPNRIFWLHEKQVHAPGCEEIPFRCILVYLYREVENLYNIEDKNREKKCPCRWVNCKRHGDCAACMAHHQAEGKYPVACQRKVPRKKNP